MPDLSLQIAALIALTTGRVKSPGVLKNSCFVKNNLEFERQKMSTKTEIVVCMASYCKVFSTILR
jgi:hypothetical protein